MTITDEPTKPPLNGAASATSETVEQLKIAVGAEPRRATADGAGLPNMDLIGYQGTEAETPLEFQLEAHVRRRSPIRNTRKSKQRGGYRHVVKV